MVLIAVIVMPQKVSSFYPPALILTTATTVPLLILRIYFALFKPHIFLRFRYVDMSSIAMSGGCRLTCFDGRARHQ